MIFSRLMETIW